MLYPLRGYGSKFVRCAVRIDLYFNSCAGPALREFHCRTPHLRRAIPTNPSNPEPNSHAAAGMGTAEFRLSNMPYTGCPELLNEENATNLISAVGRVKVKVSQVPPYTDAE